MLTAAPTRYGPCSGFTLVELLVTVTVAAILLSLAMPSFTTFVQNSRRTSEVNSLVTSLNYARSEAVKRGANIVVCASSDGSTCSGSTAAGGWKTGWIVETTDAAPDVLQVMGGLGSGNTLSGVFNGANISQLTFMPTGYVQEAAGSGIFQTTTFTLCDKRGADDAGDVEVSAIGSIQTSSTAGKAIDGTALACP
jgi:type IV fimbrial biogenesis protein FimT